VAALSSSFPGGSAGLRLACARAPGWPTPPPEGRVLSRRPSALGRETHVSGEAATKPALGAVDSVDVNELRQSRREREMLLVRNLPLGCCGC
jgi:hypothetical protein